MRKTFLKFLVTIILTCNLTACHSLIASGFWKGFQRQHLVDTKMDQGPWGGYLWVQWQSNAPGTFSESEIKAFALKHGWQFADRNEIGSTELLKWKNSDGKEIFVLLNPGSDKPDYDYPRHISEDAVVLKFDSRWMREDPGTNAMTPAYGYIMVSKDGRKMAMYHFWGNG